MTRIPSLNGLRALSILMVLAGHAAMCAGFKSWWLGIYTYAGVLVFFVVSGYLITTLMLREAEQTGTVNVGAFYIRRAWRILPVAYAYLLIITLVQYRQFSWSDIALSWTYLTSYGVSFGEFPWDLDHLWSLSVEEQFYLLWPLFFVLGIRWTKAAAWAAVLIAPIFRYFCAHYALDKAALFSFPGVVDSIATGCLIALYAKPLTRLAATSRHCGLLWLPQLAAPALMVINTRFLPGRCLSCSATAPGVCSTCLWG
jgi:peptidoglycan/LPS O-acetylase OafA/YrhL